MAFQFRSTPRTAPHIAVYAGCSHSARSAAARDDLIAYGEGLIAVFGSGTLVAVNVGYRAAKWAD
jgi:hypothetical protein